MRRDKYVSGVYVPESTYRPFLTCRRRSIGGLATKFRLGRFRAGLPGDLTQPRVKFPATYGVEPVTSRGAHPDIFEKPFIKITRPLKREKRRIVRSKKPRRFVGLVVVCIWFVEYVLQPRPEPGHKTGSPDRGPTRRVHASFSNPPRVVKRS